MLVQDGDAQNAALALTKQKIGARYIEVYPSTVQAFLQKKAILERDREREKDRDRDRERDQSEVKQYMEARSQAPATPQALVKLRGLPFSATRDDVVNWVRDKTHGFVNVSMVHMLKDATGRPSGEAYLELNTEEEGR